MSPESTLGMHLRRARERSGVSLDDVAARSRVAVHHLRALEEDRHDGLPAPVYVRGFVRAYSAEIGLPVDEALARYEAQVPAARRAPTGPPPPAVRPPAPRSPRGRRLLVLGAIAGAFVMGGVATLLVGRMRPVEDVPSRPPRPDPAGSASPAAATPSGGSAGGPATRAPGEPADTPPSPGPEVSAVSGAGPRAPVARAAGTAWVRVGPEGGDVPDGAGP
jgi:cytoskeleton protein RodZ